MIPQREPSIVELEKMSKRNDRWKGGDSGSDERNPPQTPQKGRAEINPALTAEKEAGTTPCRV